MAARTKTKVSPKYKTKYRVKNWPTYDAALKSRGDITIWFDKESIARGTRLPLVVLVDNENTPTWRS